MKLGDTFAIYSIVASPLDLSQLEIGSNTRMELDHAASTVKSILPILFSLSDIDASDLVSLTCPPRRNTQSNTPLNPGQDLPWFLVHAARYSKHCVLGQNSVLESLLMILQRPWCVLEICCCDTSIVSAVHDFVGVALKLDYVNYTPAIELLSHELYRRGRRSHDMQLNRSSLGHHISNAIHKECVAMYAKLSRSSLRSHNPFWIGLLSTCAVHLDVPFLELVMGLSGVPWGSSQQPTGLNSGPVQKRWSDGEVFPHSNPDRMQSLDSSSSIGSHVNKGFVQELLHLYARILSAAGEVIL